MNVGRLVPSLISSFSFQKHHPQKPSQMGWEEAHLRRFPVGWEWDGKLGGMLFYDGDQPHGWESKKSEMGWDGTFFFVIDRGGGGHLLETGDVAPAPLGRGALLDAVGLALESQRRLAGADVPAGSRVAGGKPQRAGGLSFFGPGGGERRGSEERRFQPEVRSLRA